MMRRCFQFILHFNTEKGNTQPKSAPCRPGIRFSKIAVERKTGARDIEKFRYL